MDEISTSRTINANSCYSLLSGGLVLVDLPSQQFKVCVRELTADLPPPRQYLSPSTDLMKQSSNTQGR